VPLICARALNRTGQDMTLQACGSQKISLTKSHGHYQRQAAIGLSLAFLIFACALVLHIGLIFYWHMSAIGFAIPAFVALQSWLYTGLFIVAHDCMHGSLVPFRPNWNRAIGSALLFLYAGFPFDKLNRYHHAHHRHSGTVQDPDFDARPPHGFFNWYAKFLMEYVTWRQPVILGGAITFYVAALGVPALKAFLFWALPALLSTVLLFTFGTYLPHKPSHKPFSDRHNARSNNYSWLLSLLTCFHFGYHHEHHSSPGTPWWALPSLHAKFKDKHKAVSSL
jgi:beta-carotene ketolase (CrtW type)